MNKSKKSDPRFWKKWARSGAMMPWFATRERMGYKDVTFWRLRCAMPMREVLASMERCGSRPMTVEEVKAVIANSEDASPRTRALAPSNYIPVFSYEDGGLQFNWSSQDQWHDRLRFPTLR